LVDDLIEFLEFVVGRLEVCGGYDALKFIGSVARLAYRNESNLDLGGRQEATKLCELGLKTVLWRVPPEDVVVDN